MSPSKPFGATSRTVRITSKRHGRNHQLQVELLRTLRVHQVRRLPQAGLATNYRILTHVTNSVRHRVSLASFKMKTKSGSKTFLNKVGVNAVVLLNGFKFME